MLTNRAAQQPTSGLYEHERKKTLRTPLPKTTALNFCTEHSRGTWTTVTIDTERLTS